MMEAKRVPSWRIALYVLEAMARFMAAIMVGFWFLTISALAATYVLETATLEGMARFAPMGLLITGIGLGAYVSLRIMGYGQAVRRGN